MPIGYLKFMLLIDSKIDFVSKISFVQNQWNFYTNTDYYAYKNYRENVQQSIDQKISLLIFDTWNQKKINKKDYEQYIEDFN